MFLYKMPRHSPIKLKRVRAMWKSAKKDTSNHQIESVFRNVQIAKGWGKNSPPEVNRKIGINNASLALACFKQCRVSAVYSGINPKEGDGGHDDILEKHSPPHGPLHKRSEGFPE